MKDIKDNILKIVKTKKFIISSILILILIGIILGVVNYIQQEPSRLVNDYFKTLKINQYDSTQNYLDKGMEYFDNSYLNEENLKTHLGKMEFNIVKQEVVNDVAVVTIWIKRPNLVNSIKEYTALSIKDIFSKKSKEEIEEEKNNFFKTQFAENKILIEEIECQINLVKLNDKWKIKNDENLKRSIYFGKTVNTTPNSLNNNIKTEKEEEIYLDEYMKLNNYKVGFSSSWGEGDVPSVSKLEFKNNGNKDISTITVTVYFKDENGKNIAEKSVVVIGSYDTPLKAGYSWRMEDDRYYELENLTSEIDMNRSEVKITKIEFKKNIGLVNNEKQDYINNQMELKNSKVGFSSSWGEGDVPSVSKLEFKNNGDKDISTVTITVYFKDENGKNIAENVITVIGSYDDTLKAGYSWRMEDDRYYELKNLTSEIDMNRSEVKITDIDFK